MGSERIVLITGSNGQLGTAMIKAFGDAGYKTIGMDLCAPDESACKPDLFLKADVTQRQQVADAAEQLAQKVDHLDALVNNAGVAVFSKFEDRTEDELDHVISVNTKGMIWASQCFLPLLKSSASPSIVNIASLYGNVSADPRIYTDCARNSSEIYGMTKAGVVQLTRYLAVHLAKDQVRVNCISPGGVFNQQGDDFVANYSHRCPMGRMAEAHEIAGPAVFLASEAASYVNGHNLMVDGGMTSW